MNFLGYLIYRKGTVPKGYGSLYMTLPVWADKRYAPNVFDVTKPEDFEVKAIYFDDGKLVLK